MTTTLSTAVRSAIRAAASARGSSCPIIVVADSEAAPAIAGADGYHTFRKGGVCLYPGAALRAGYKVDYHPSTRRIEVGAGWLLSITDPTAYARRQAARKGAATRAARKVAMTILGAANALLADWAAADDHYAETGLALPGRPA